MFLDCRNLGYRYPLSDDRVFQGITFQLNTPGFHALFGPSGVGKTTLARILTGDIPEYSGKIIRPENPVFLYTYNQERLPGWSSVGQHLDKITPDHKTDIRRELVETFGMAPFMDQRFSQLSLGQKNRINLIRYLLQEFDLLVMDESLANVDEKSKETIIFKIKTLFPDRFFLYISHNLMEVSRFSHTILVLLKAGRTPQITRVQGLDIYPGDSVDKTRLDTVLLEIMNAS